MRAIGDSAFTAKEGQRFADQYRVADIGRACDTFESGTTPFTSARARRS
jgi:hypothetical protein